MLERRYSRKKTVFKIIFCIIVISAVGFAMYGSYSYFNNQLSIQRENDARILAAKAKAAALAAIEAKKKEAVYITLPGAHRIRAIVQDYSKPNSIWAIVSKARPISVNYIPANLIIPGVETRRDKSDLERSIRSDIEKPTINMFDAAKSASHLIMIGSGYRSATLQAVYFNSLASSIGETAANQSIARPGQSEHQTGLAMDISTVARNCYLDECFATTGDGLWLVNNSYKYGFILRYPKGSEVITGYRYEPWHFRYVGVDLATALYESNMTLDQAWPYLQKADTTLRQNGAI